ncbi:UNVERIFIED_CONTAM: hypothetical protein H355_005408 [Colinus virginianus]|nr:hypothetical protein H355_005408 [Colinus virginianus]
MRRIALKIVFAKASQREQNLLLMVYIRSLKTTRKDISLPPPFWKFLMLKLLRIRQLAFRFSFSLIVFVREELFGPVLCVMKVESLQSAIDIVNHSAYGNGTAIFTKSGFNARMFQHLVNVGQVSKKKSLRYRIRLQVYFSVGGRRVTCMQLAMHNLFLQVGINVPVAVPPPHFSFTGWKCSMRGALHFNGRMGVEFFTKTKTVVSLWKGKEDGRIYDELVGTAAAASSSSFP